MAYAFVVSPCCACGQPFTYNPHAVPSARRTPDSPREPICRTCVERANPERIKRGLPPIRILPDAYKPITEEEL